MPVLPVCTTYRRNRDQGRDSGDSRNVAQPLPHYQITTFSATSPSVKYAPSRVARGREAE